MNFQSSLLSIFYRISNVVHVGCVDIFWNSPLEFQEAKSSGEKKSNTTLSMFQISDSGSREAEQIGRRANNFHKNLADGG